MNARGSKGKASPSKSGKATASRAKARTRAKARPEAPAPESPVDGALERGDLFFFYRPDVGDDAPGGLLDVRRFHVVLRPSGGGVTRMIAVGRKMLPG